MPIYDIILGKYNIDALLGAKLVKVYQIKQKKGSFSAFYLFTHVELTY